MRVKSGGDGMVVEGKEWDDAVRRSHDMEATRGEGLAQISEADDASDSVGRSRFLVSEAASLAGLTLGHERDLPVQHST
jgi:hypothetical protein